MRLGIIQIFLLILLTVLGGVTHANSQIQTPKSGDDSARPSRVIQGADDCIQALDKTLEALERETAARLALVQQVAAGESLLAKEREFNAELLKAVELLTSAEKRNKSFFRRLTEQLTRVLKAATRPESLVTLAGLIIVLRRG